MLPDAAVLTGGKPHQLFAIFIFFTRIKMPCKNKAFNKGLVSE